MVNIPYTTEEDVKRTMLIVRDELKKNNIVINDLDLRNLTVDIMAISYGKGGGYSDYEIRAYTKSYIARDIHKKFISK